MKRRSALFAALSILFSTCDYAAVPPAAQPGVVPGVVLVELFTSEGCSSCPPADALLAQLNGQRLPDGKRIVGLSEHVTYWNNLGWADPYASTLFTERQQAYAARFALDSVYTPQAVVSGRFQFVGSDADGLKGGIARAEANQPVHLQVLAATVADHVLTLHFSAQAAAWPKTLTLTAAVADDADRSHVLRGENSGRLLDHVNVVRALIPVAQLGRDTERTVRIPLPEASFANPGTGHLLVLFAQAGAAGSVLGADAVPLQL